MRQKRSLRNIRGTVVLTYILAMSSFGQITPGVVEGNTAFGLSLFGRLKSSSGNLFFSPYSVSTCLSMIYAGARGETEKQMADVLHLPLAQGEVHRSFAELGRGLNQQTNGMEVSVANGLWAQRSHPFLPTFLELVRVDYRGVLEQLDFKTQAAEATTRINDWVAESTRNRIRNILAPGQLNTSTRLVLANATYFKGSWAVPFDKNETLPQPFFISAQQQIQASLMHHLDTVRYLDGGTFQAVELPYVGRQFAMVVLLPRNATGLAPLEDSLNITNLNNWLKGMNRLKVELLLPKFKLESPTMALAPILASMGMVDAFQPKADFSGIDGTKDLLISSVSHKAFVEVSEEGTEAAAATVGAMALASAVTRPPAPPPVFRADHPFLFLIRDVRSGTVLFLGRLNDPGK